MMPYQSYKLLEDIRPHFRSKEGRLQTPESSTRSRKQNQIATKQFLLAQQILNKVLQLFKHSSNSTNTQQLTKRASRN